MKLNLAQIAEMQAENDELVRRSALAQSAREAQADLPRYARDEERRRRRSPNQQAYHRKVLP